MCKTYTKFTFTIKSQRYFSDKYLLYYCIHLSTKFFPAVSKKYETKDPFLFSVKGEPQRRDKFISSESPQNLAK